MENWSAALGAGSDFRFIDLQLTGLSTLRKATMKINQRSAMGGSSCMFPQCPITTKAIRDHLGRHARRSVWNDEKRQGWQRCGAGPICHSLLLAF